MAFLKLTKSRVSRDLADRSQLTTVSILQRLWASSVRDHNPTWLHVNSEDLGIWRRFRFFVLGHPPS